MKKQTFSLWETYKECCKAEDVKTRKRAFRETERALKQTCAELKGNRKVLVLHRDIDDTFSYVVVLDNGTVHPSILRKEDVEARIAYAREKPDRDHF